eukprot:6207942-Pleurochrysis_carterae.AAC.2
MLLVCVLLDAVHASLASGGRRSRPFPTGRGWGPASSTGKYMKLTYGGRANIKIFLCTITGIPQ